MFLLLKSTKRSISVACLVSVLCACEPSRYQTIRNVYRPPDPVTQGVHRVKAGETLYAIAWRYNRNHLELARANGINPPYRIYPDQRIDLGKKPENAGAITNPPKSTPVKKEPSRYKNPPTHAKPVQEKLANQRDKKVDMLWRWPAKGAVVRSYSLTGKVNKGINIAGSLGEPVYAAADGNVVYSGTGLVGYGNLIILKHSDEFLSAYAHNSQILVKEGDRAKAGQKIAEIGSTGASRNQLHFEIRRNGKPVNPLQYLPVR